MHNKWLIQDSYFGTIKEIRGATISPEAMLQFFDDVVRKHPNKIPLIQEFSNIHVLLASADAQQYVREGESTWADILTSEQYDTLERNRHLVIGFMLITQNCETGLDFIEYMDTMVRGHHLGRHMCTKYKNETHHKLLPRIIVKTSVNYWAKELDVINDEGKIERRLIDQSIEPTRNTTEDINWEELYMLCFDSLDRVATDACSCVTSPASHDFCSLPEPNSYSMSSKSERDLLVVGL